MCSLSALAFYFFLNFMASEDLTHNSHPSDTDCMDLFSLVVNFKIYNLKGYLQILDFTAPVNVVLNGWQINSNNISKEVLL